MSKITNEMLLNAINSVNSQLGTLKVEVENLKADVTTLKGGKGKSAKPTVSTKGATEKATTKFSTKVEDYEPKKDNDGNYNWASYKANRTKFCYAVVTNGVCNKNPYGTDWGKTNTVDYSENSPYYKAKAKFEKKFKYITIANR